jgi:hypothetical protein
VIVPIPQNANYTVEMSSDDELYGGWNQVAHMKHPSKQQNGSSYIELYLPARTAIVLKEGKPKAVRKAASKQ